MGLAALFIALFLPMVFMLVVLAEDKKEHPENYPKTPDFDERQQADQALATRCAFWTVCGFLMLWLILENFKIRLWEAGFGAALGVFLGLGVFSVVCILRHAFFQPKMKGKWVPVFSVHTSAFGCCCVLSEDFNRNLLLRDGVLTIEAASWLIPLFVIVMDAALLARFILDKKRTQREAGI